MGATANQSNKADKITYKELRLLIGLSAVGLPFFLIIGHIIHNAIYGNGFEIIFQGSMSSYYYTRMGDVFVGTLIAQGLFLLAYVGYPSEEDNKVGNWAGLFAMLTALAPTSAEGVDKVPQNYIHLISAFTFFMFLAYYCLVLFRRTNQKLLNEELPPSGIKRIWAEATRTPEFEDTDGNARKIRRNSVYKFCGRVIVGSILLLLVLVIVDATIVDLDGLYYTLWLEAIATEAFGIAWLVKSEKWIFKDVTPSNVASSSIPVDDPTVETSEET
ncbi:MAG: hypothetical protein GPJ54_06145 [Candidatus Heimdallarchaeota archaeon]|nr:hypothetical protein [Candidatus Heimdallarchaeota archaeon]